jgi:membrane protease YdiL (CAAX protease family)
MTKSWWGLIRNLLILLAVIGSFAYSAFPIALPLGLLSKPEGRAGVFLVGSIFGELAAMFVLVRFLKRSGGNLNDLGFRQPTTRLALLSGVFVALVYSGWTALNPHVGPGMLQLSILKIPAIVAALVAGVVEEVIFRGYVMTTLLQMGYGNVVQVLVGGITFALAHLYGFTSPEAFLITQGSTFILGIMLGIIYLIGRRSLTPVIVSHALTDMIIEPALLLTFFTVIK